MEPTSRMGTSLPDVTVASLIATNGAAFGPRPAIIAPGTTLTWTDLASVVGLWVTAMRDHGVRRNHRIAISMRDGAEMALAFLSAASAGTAAGRQQRDHLLLWIRVAIESDPP